MTHPTDPVAYVIWRHRTAWSRMTKDGRVKCMCGWASDPTWAGRAMEEVYADHVAEQIHALPADELLAPFVPSAPFKPEEERP